MFKEVGHFLLKRLGKTKLRPGGITATNWLLKQVQFTADTKVLEVACNEAETLMCLAKKYHCACTGIDINEKAIAQAIKKVVKEELQDKVKLQVASALDLPFVDNTFDVVINEAMLTMLSMEEKAQAIKEYYRVLKKGGILLTHDVMLIKEDSKLIETLRSVINFPVTPLTKENWLNLFQNNGFEEVIEKDDPMTLMSDKGMILDEGEERAKLIHDNAMKDKNKGQFLSMKKLFTSSDDKLHYIAIRSIKK